MKHLIAIKVPELFTQRFSAVTTLLAEYDIETPFKKMEPHITIIPPIDMDTDLMVQKAQGLSKCFASVDCLDTFTNSHVSLLKIRIHGVLHAQCKMIRYQFKVPGIHKIDMGQTSWDPHVTLAKGRGLNHPEICKILMENLAVSLLSMVWYIETVSIYEKHDKPLGWLECREIQLV